MNDNEQPLLDRDQIMSAIHKLGIEEQVLKELVIWIIYSYRKLDYENIELKSRLSIIRKLNDAKWHKEELEALTDLSVCARVFREKFCDICDM